AGHLGARGGTDLMVAMNPQTWDRDVAGIEPGGYLLYDCTKPLPTSKFRDDITVIGVPLTAICNREYTDARQRQLFKNAVYGGATVCAWYPITPSSSLADAFTGHCRRLRVDPVTKKNKVAIVQAEDELASIGMVIGAAWNGARAFTATSGPGISLMQEFLGLAYFAEIPAVIFDIQRGSPSTGMPTRTQQADILSCAYASHGDTKHVLLFPEDPREAFTFAADALDLADRLQTPIFVMLDLDIGMNDWLVEPLAWDDTRRLDRGKVMSYAELEAGKDFGRYLDVDGDGIPYRTYPGTHPNRGSYFTRGSTKDRYARYTEDGSTYVDNMQRLQRKFETARQYLPRPVRKDAAQKTHCGAIDFGS